MVRLARALLAALVVVALAPPAVAHDACDYDYGTVVPLVTHRVVTEHWRCHGTYGGDEVTQRVERVEVQEADGAAPGGWASVARVEVFAEEWREPDGDTIVAQRVTLHAAGATATLAHDAWRPAGEPESCRWGAGASRGDRSVWYGAPPGTPCWPRGLLLP